MMSLYDTDFYAWSQAQVDALEAQQWHALDLEHLMEEIADLGHEQRHAVSSQLCHLLQHLLKWRYQPTHRSPSRRRSIRQARHAIARRLEQSLSLRQAVPSLLDGEYRRARREAQDETGLPLATFPESCPWSVDQLLDEDVWPDV
jgi:ribosomal protein L29